MKQPSMVLFFGTDEQQNCGRCGKVRNIGQIARDRQHCENCLEIKKSIPKRKDKTSEKSRRKFEKDEKQRKKTQLPKKRSKNIVYCSKRDCSIRGGRMPEDKKANKHQKQSRQQKMTTKNSNNLYKQSKPPQQNHTKAL